MRGQGVAPAPAALTRAPGMGIAISLSFPILMSRHSIHRPLQSSTWLERRSSERARLDPAPAPRRVFARAADARAVGARRCGAVPAGFFAVRVASFAPWQFARALQPSCQSCRRLRHHARRPRLSAPCARRAHSRTCTDARSSSRASSEAR